MRDLGAGRRDEEVVHRSRRAFLARSELCHRPVEMVFDDVLGAAELAQGGQAQGVGASPALDVPETGEDELEVRRLDAVLFPRRQRNATACRAKLDAPGGDLIQDGLLELELDLDTPAG